MTFDSLVEAWQARTAANPRQVALRYFDAEMTAAEVDRASDALAVALDEAGTARGDRVGLYLQNVPHYALALLALWKLGAVPLLLNPMYKHAELRSLIDDSGAIGIICTDTDVAETRDTVANGTVRWLISTSARDFQTDDDPRAFPPAAAPVDAAFVADTGSTARADAGASTVSDMAALIRLHAGRKPAAICLGRTDLALLSYTSGTTGPPKGAMNTHGNVLEVATTFSEWVGLAPNDVVLAVAPLFHITGAVINCAISLITDTTLVFTGRFHPELVLEAFARHRITYTIGSITVFNALLELPQAAPEHFASVKTLYSGGPRSLRPRWTGSVTDSASISTMPTA
nr:class I adenylate-forming enzyme family protein [Cryobacterium sp. MLB-32]